MGKRMGKFNRKQRYSPKFEKKGGVKEEKAMGTGWREKGEVEREGERRRRGETEKAVLLGFTAPEQTLFGSTLTSFLILFLI